MYQKENYFQVLPNETFNVLAKTGRSDLCIDAILCDGINNKIAAKAVTPIAIVDGEILAAPINEGHVTSNANGSYSANDSSTKTILTPVIQGQFEEVFVSSTSEAVRVHLAKVV
jgi:hypothetical protein